MKKNGCEAVFYCRYHDCKHRAGDPCRSEKYNSYGCNLCTNRKAQRDAMKTKTRWTKKPATKEGWYWLKNGDLKIIGQALDTDLTHWSLTTHDGIFNWNSLVFQGYKRSVKPIEED